MTAQEHAERIAKALEAISAIEPDGNMLTGNGHDDQFTRRIKAHMEFASVATWPALIALLSERTALLARVGELEGALRWYGEQSRLCRLIHSEGDAGRSALSEDGWQRARAALKGQP